MIKFGRIIDANTGLGIPYASIEITDQSGIYTGAGTSSGVTGNFALDSLQMKPGTFMRITSSGYKPISVPYTTYANITDFSLIPNYITIDPVVITASKKTAADNAALWYAAAGIGFLFLLLRKK